MDLNVGMITESQGGNGGGLYMLGRSDGVLNREVSPFLLSFFSLTFVSYFSLWNPIRLK